MMTGCTRSTPAAPAMSPRSRWRTVP
jgi:hypothetical protein